MKREHWLGLAGLLLGLAVGAAAFAHVQAGRYLVVNVGPVDLPHPMRVDTLTGKTWLFQGGWIECRELKN